MGRQVSFSLSLDRATSFTVVGVIADVAGSRAAADDRPQIFVSYRQQYAPRMVMLIRGRGDAAGFAARIQSAMLAADPALTMPLVESSEALVRRSTEAQRRAAQSSAGFGVLVLLLAAVGVYGVVSLAVTGRTREFGLRMALGATQRRVLAIVVREAVMLAVPGLLGGAVVAAVVAISMGPMLLSVSPVDPVTYGACAALLVVVVLAASVVPARRATAIVPMDALRAD